LQTAQRINTKTLYNQAKLGNYMKNLIYISLFAILLPTMSYGEDKHAEHTEEHQISSGVEMLSHDLRELLSQEMKALQGGMMSIIPAYISGNWGEIETTARKIKSSYILKQNLTEDQLKELQSLLPPEFIEKDQNFHYLAGMLEHAAKNKKPELINFYFSEMNESCVSCHAAFATHRFPALMPKATGDHAH
jgi:hypothetical protein